MQVRKVIAFQNTHARALLLVFAVSVCTLFLIGNRGSSRGFFYEDDFDNLANARQVELSYYFFALVRPMIAPDSVFRPVPDFYYYVMSRVAPLHFPPYIRIIQAIHLGNVLMVWLLARSLGASRLGACAATLLFAFHAAMFQIYWRPMYVFDLVCATFVLLTVLTYLRGGLLLSLVFFWLALKSKEMAVFLPLVLIAYECFFGKRRWLRAAPFLAISTLFGLWALAYNVHRDDAYSLRFSPAAIWTCTLYYAEKLVSAPAWIGLAAIAVIFIFARHRLVRIGLVTFFSLMLVLLVLPGRISGAYLYTASIGLALAIAALTRPVWLAVFFAFWIPWNYRQLRVERKAELAAADERRTWFTVAQQFVKTHPQTDTFVYEMSPGTLGSFGISGALRCLRPPYERIYVADAESPDRFAALARPNLAVLIWDPFWRTLDVKPREPDTAFLTLNYTAPLWQLGEGWIGLDRNFRWMAPHAVARLDRPKDATRFEITTARPRELPDGVHTTLRVSVDHREIGTANISEADVRTFRFDFNPGAAGTVEVELDASPGFQDGTRTLALPILSFGFK